MIPEERNDDVKLAACNALYYGLEFAKRNFEVEEERQVIMNVSVSFLSLSRFFLSFSFILSFSLDLSVLFLSWLFHLSRSDVFVSKVILEACTHPNPKVRVAAYEVLVKIASLYYEYLAPSMQRIFNVLRILHQLSMIFFFDLLN